MFIDDEPRIRRDCKYTVSKVSGNRAISLGRVSLGNKFYQTGTVTSQVFRRNPYDRNTAALTDSILGEWL